MIRKQKLDVEHLPEISSPLIQKTSKNITQSHTSKKIASNQDKLDHIIVKKQEVTREKASIILKNINFSLNSQLHKKKKGKLEIQDNSKKDKTILKQNIITRNILDKRERKDLQSSYSLRPRNLLKPTKTIKNGTLVLLENNQRSRSIINIKNPPLIKLKFNRRSEKELDKVRLEVVKWLLEYRKDVVQILNEKKKMFVDSVAYVGEINQGEFEMIMDQIGIDKEDKTVKQRLYWVFDLDDNGSIDSKEVAYAINLFREYSLEEKAKIFFNYCDEQDNGFVTPDEFKVFLVGNVQTLEDKKIVKQLSKDLFKEILILQPSLNHVETLNFEQIYSAAIKDTNIRQIIEKNTRILKTTKHEEYVTPSQYLLEKNHSSGLFYPELDNFYHALQEKSKIHNYNQNLKSQIINKKKDEEDEQLFN